MAIVYLEIENIASCGEYTEDEYLILIKKLAEIKGDKHPEDIGISNPYVMDALHRTLSYSEVNSVSSELPRLIEQSLEFYKIGLMSKRSINCLRSLHVKLAHQIMEAKFPQL